MITEYHVLDALSGGGWLMIDEISPSPEWDDRWATKKMLEMLENAKLVESLHFTNSADSYHISIAGEYRLQQLKEQLAFQQKTAEDAEKQRKTAKIQFVFTAIIGILTLAAGIVAAVAAILPLVLK